MTTACNPHLLFLCHFCGFEGHRSLTYQARPGQTPAFDDVCPRCGRNDVDIYDGRHQYERPGSNAAPLDVFDIGPNISDKTLPKDKFER